MRQTETTLDGQPEIYDIIAKFSRCFVTKSVWGTNDLKLDIVRLRNTAERIGIADFPAAPYCSLHWSY